MQKNQQFIPITLPDLNKDNFVASYAQIRPYRKNGYRMEHQIINDKHIFHNYGHGGAGISLGYGSAYISAKSIGIFADPNHTLQCAVIGAGVIGMLTALELSKIGHKVAIYSEKISKLNQKNNEKCIASQVAPGLWLPYGYENNDLLQHELMAKLSYDFYSQSIKRKRYQSMKFVDVYDQCLSEDQLKQAFPIWIDDAQFRKVSVKFENGLVQQYTAFRTIKVNTELFLEEIKTQCVLRGVKIHEKKFNSLEQVLKLNQPCIYNCTGFGAKKIFHDDNIIGIRGHLLEFQNPNPQKYNYFLRNKVLLPKGLLKDIQQSERKVYMYCHDKKIIIGLTRQEGQQQATVDSKIADKLFSNLRSFLSERRIRPKL